MSERHRSGALKSERLVGQAHLPTKSSPAHARAAVSKTGVTHLGKQDVSQEAPASPADLSCL